jgi:hypothetical protein
MIMQQLVIDPPRPFLIPTDAPIHLCIVGCGGTGSHIAQAAARLAYHVQARGDVPPLHITLIESRPKTSGGSCSAVLTLASTKRSRWPHA